MLHTRKSHTLREVAVPLKGGTKLSPAHINGGVTISFLHAMVVLVCFPKLLSSGRSWKLGVENAVKIKLL